MPKEFNMSFLYPLLSSLRKYLNNTDIRWGEANLNRKKKEENNRRSPGPNIDFVIETRNNGCIELAVGEIPGAPTSQSHEQCLGNRQEIAKDLKTNTNKGINIQIYQFKVHFYRQLSFLKLTVSLL